MKEYLDEWKIRSIIKKYSDYVQYPIIMDITRTAPAKGVDGKPIEGGGDIKKTTEETLNSMKAIWTRPKSEITDEEYEEFYKHISHDYDKPLSPSTTPPRGPASSRHSSTCRPAPSTSSPGTEKGVQLYVKRVFITDNCEDLLPDYLRFVKGVVDSSDLPLNVSREILQEDVQIKRIQKNLVGKILAPWRR